MNRISFLNRGYAFKGLLAVDHVNVDVHTKFGQILSICSRDIERKPNSDVNQGP